MELLISSFVGVAALIIFFAVYFCPDILLNAVEFLIRLIFGRWAERIRPILERMDRTPVGRILGGIFSFFIWAILLFWGYHLYTTINPLILGLA